jgi:hypothetical protein
VVCGALGDLYYATNGAGWARTGPASVGGNAGWSAAASGIPTDYCTFLQQCCGTPCINGVLVELQLHLNNLTGTIPESIGSLTSLTALLLAANNLIGTIPYSFGSLTSLQALYIQGAPLALTGTLPSSMSQLTRITTLYLHGSGICGYNPIPFNNHVPSDGNLPACV